MSKQVIESKKLNSQQFSKHREKLYKLFEKDLVDSLLECSVLKFRKDGLVGRPEDEDPFVPFVLEGSVRIVRYDIFGKEVLIYNIAPMESCIIGITSVWRENIEKGASISNEDLYLLHIPKSLVYLFMEKYQKWREFTFMLNEQRMQELIFKNNEISIKNKEIHDSIVYAKRIQQAVLPNEDTISDLLPEHFILFKPRDIVSGDYYWISKIEGKVVVIVADCTGHGVPGAFMSMLGISLLNKLSKEFKETNAADILNILREDVIASLNQGLGTFEQVKDGMDMAVMIFDFESLNMQFAGAYNPFYLIRDRELQQFKGDRMPVGLHVVETKNFTNRQVKLESGDVIYAFSDGYVDQIDKFGSKKFLAKNFKSLLLQINQFPLAEQKQILDSKIEEWKGQYSQIDDILVMGIRV
jgi:serine phosphatase RsbU (regulator of sigma subunit)